MNFETIIGHNKNIQYLQKLLLSDRIPHAILFSGISGLGKRRVAVSFAANLNCNNPLVTGACGICQSCLKLIAGTHPFIKFIGSPKEEESIEIDYDANNTVHIPNTVSDSSETSKHVTKKINIHQIRALIHESSLKSYSGEKKIFIIDDVAETSLEALNCLLKILEEPPADTYFILITSKEEHLLPTIISRCQKLHFAPLSRNDILNFANANISESLPEEELNKLISISGGSPGKFMKLLNTKNLDFIPSAPEKFFEESRKWFADNDDCLLKLNIMLEIISDKFRNSPDEDLCRSLSIIERTIDIVRKNVNAELAVSNMFLQLGRLDQLI